MQDGGSLVGMFNEIPPEGKDILRMVLADNGVQMPDTAGPAEMSDYVRNMRLESFGKWFGMMTKIDGEMMGEGLMLMGMSE